MPVENSVHYSTDDTLGQLEWETLLPSGNGLLYTGPSEQVFSIGLFHQLRCLNIVRSTLVNIFAHPERATPNTDDQPLIVQHCMDYLRQMVLCHADLTALNLAAVDARRGHVQASEVTHVCKDFSVIFAAAEENYAMYGR
jgi:hypothetical protein